MIVPAVCPELFVQFLCCSFMEHKGIPYRILQTANPTGWKWIVEFDAGRTKSGDTYSRIRAIKLAETAIDKMLGKQPASLSQI
jgi:hypothetical protein